EPLNSGILTKFHYDVFCPFFVKYQIEIIVNKEVKNMRRFSSLLLAAVLGSVITVASYRWLDDDKDKVRLEYVANIPTAKVAYTTDENGKAVPLDFTAAAEKVMPSVVHI